MTQKNMLCQNHWPKTQSQSMVHLPANGLLEGRETTLRLCYKICVSPSPHPSKRDKNIHSKQAHVFVAKDPTKLTDLQCKSTRQRFSCFVHCFSISSAQKVPGSEHTQQVLRILLEKLRPVSPCLMSSHPLQQTASILEIVFSQQPVFSIFVISPL